MTQEQENEELLKDIRNAELLAKTRPTEKEQKAFYNWACGEIFKKYLDKFIKQK